MSGAGAGAGGRLVVMDRAGRDTRSFPLRGGLATLGSDHACDIRVMLPAVARHHATIAVHTAQTVIRNVEGSATLVNGAPVSVAALRHGDVITLAGRRLRWEYDDPTGRRQPREASPSVKPVATAAGAGAGAGSGRGKRRGSEGGGGGGGALHRDRALHLALEMTHRASMPLPGTSGGKQVAIVQPQRRDTSERIGVEQTRSSPLPKRRSNGADSPPSAPAPSNAPGGAAVPAHTTQATLWIESRKTSPRRAKSLQVSSEVGTGAGCGWGRGRGRKSTPLRMAVLKRARAHRPSLVKIQAPLTIDYTKQAAIMLMTGHTKSKSSKSPSYVVKKQSPVRKTPRTSRRTLESGPRLALGSQTTRTSGSPSARTSGSPSARTSRSPVTRTSGGLASCTPGSPVLRTPGSPASRTPGSPASRNPGSPASRTPGSPASRIPGSPASRTPGSPASRNPGSPASRTPGSPASRTPGSPASRTPGSPASRTPGSPASRTPGSPASRTPGSPASRNPGSPASRTPGSPASRTPGSPASRTPGSPASRTPGSPASRTPGSPASRTPGSPASRTPGSTASRTPRSPGPHAPVSPASRTFGSPTSRTPVNRSTRSMGNQSVTIVEIRESESRGGEVSSISTRSSESPQKSPPLPSPKKSALKDTSKKTIRKIESIKFDLSNLENHQEPDVVLLSESTKHSDGNVSEEDITLRYSESSVQSHSPSPSPSPSPRHWIHSRSAGIFEKLGSTLTLFSPSRTLTPQSRSPSSRKSARGSLIVQKASDEGSTYDYTKSESRVASAFRTRTLSPRKTIESYSIVDLVSLDSNDASVYSSADCTHSTTTGEYGTPQTTVAILGSSTPYRGDGRRTRSTSNLTGSASPATSVSTRRSKSLSTPENKPVSAKSTRVSRRSRSRSRINDSDLLLLDDTELEDASPKSSKRSRSTKSLVNVSDVSERRTGGTSTPENGRSPDGVDTPVLSIQTLLDSSRSSLASHASSKGGRRTFRSKRNTIGVISEVRTRAPASAGRRANESLGFSAKKTVLRLSRGSSETSNKTDEGAPQPDNEETVTPKSAVKLVPEAVKNKHSTAKKPQSKRSLIDDLNRSDIVKQLFNSPVKRKLSQSMTEFSRKQSVGMKETRRSTRSAGRARGAADNDTVGPIRTPSDSPDMTGIKRLFERNTPKDDLRDVRGVRSLLRTPAPRTRRTVGKESSHVRGVKATFTRRSPRNDLRNVSGVKAIFDRRTPRNDLTDVRGVRKMFQRHERRRDETIDMSGIEELFDSSAPSVHESEALFDRLVGRPVVKAVYSKSLSAAELRTRTRTRSRRKLATSLRDSIDVIANNVEEWLERELQKRLHRADISKSKVTKELQRLATETVQGEEPIRLSRTRNSSMKGSASETYGAHTLPIKKRSLVRVSSDTSKNKLPIKKRAVVHSTPVKGRVNFTMNASELGRVSPIAVLDHTSHHARSGRSTRRMPVGGGVGEPGEGESGTSGTRRVTRARKERNAKIRRTSLVITKKSPVMSPTEDPAPPPEASSSKNTVRSDPSARPSRPSRAINDKTIETPKKTRPRARLPRLVVAEPSPQPRGRGRGQGRGRSAHPERPVPLAEPETRPNRTKRVRIESPKRPQRGRMPTEPKSEERPEPKRTRSRTAQTDRSTAAPGEAPKRSRRGKPDLTTTALTKKKSTRRNEGVEAGTDVEVPSETRRRGKTTVDPSASTGAGGGGGGRDPAPAPAPAPLTQTQGRKRKATRPVPEEITSKVSKIETVERKATLRKRNKDESSVNKTVRGRRKVERTELSETSEQKATSSRGNKDESTNKTVRGRRKIEGTASSETSEQKATLSRGNKDESTNKTVRGRRKIEGTASSETSEQKATLSRGNKDESSTNKTVRGRRKIDVTESPGASRRATRGPKAVTEDTSTGVGKWKRKRDASPTKESRKKASATLSPSPAPSPVKTRRARAAVPAPAPAPAPTASVAARTRTRTCTRRR